MQFASNKLLVFGLALVFSGALIVVLRMTLLGKGVRALMQSPWARNWWASTPKRLHPLMFGIGLGLSGVAGCLLSMAYTISPSMGEPYTVTALIVITLGGFGSMSGALAGGLALGVIEALGMHFTNPSLKACCRTACSSRYCCCARKGFSPNEHDKGSFATAGPVRPDWMGHGPAALRQRIRRLDGADLPDVRGAVVELGAVLRQFALPVAGDVRLLRHWRLHQCAGAGAAALGGCHCPGCRPCHGGGGGDGGGRAASARHLLSRC
jgi:hypothetical protein